jgi:hypothetical protein
MIDIIDFYKPISKLQPSIKKGQICYTPIPYLLKNPIPQLKVDYYNKDKPDNCNYKIEYTEIKDSDKVKYPLIPKLKMEEGEFLLCQKYKFRPVIIFTDLLPVSGLNTFGSESGYLAIPLYGVYKDLDNDFLLKIRAYTYQTLFYLPDSPDKTFLESIARFDRICLVKEEFLRLKPLYLSDKALFCITKWLQHFLGALLDSALAEYRKEAQEKLSRILGKS